MGCGVIITPRAQADFQEIVRFIRRDNPARARSFARELVLAAQQLGDWPEIGRVVPELGDPDVREIVHGAYRIIYEFHRDLQALYVLRFWHGARGEPETSGLP